jgi:phage pi2 protein 07
MKSLIKTLYYGTLNPDDKILKEDKEYQKLSDQILIIMEKLKKESSDEKFKSITELMDLTSESNSLETENAFLHGFRYGALIMMEILSD